MIVTQLIRVKNVMTQEELDMFYELNELVLTATTSNERRFYNEEIADLIDHVKKRYVDQKEGEISNIMSEMVSFNDFIIALEHERKRLQNATSYRRTTADLSYLVA